MTLKNDMTMTFSDTILQDYNCYYLSVNMYIENKPYKEGRWKCYYT